MKNPPTMREMCVWSLGQEEPLEEGVATHCSVPAGRMPWTEELAGCWWAVVRGVQSQTRLSRSMVRPGASWARILGLTSRLRIFIVPALKPTGIMDLLNLFYVSY